ncbi:Fic family protein [Streptococcus sp. NLN64]|uniref:Fic family protein n=1 Tax=Streptococcus sp. NLN64 TaxID=2822799 RepID=UPI0018CBB60C|nr:Fic family protein [Streptococcus sp. NLN64]MBG9367913.1 Fic family protein [Streptococcus sp. NLN64]
MDYKELKKVYYGNFDAYEREYQQRLEGYSTIVTQLYPRLMKRENFQTSSYPLFVVVLPTILMLIEKITVASGKIQDLAADLPAVAHYQFFSEQMYQSIISTNAIEGIRTRRKDLVEAHRIVTESPDAESTRKNLSTVKMYQQILEGTTFNLQTLKDIRSLYDLLLEGEVGSEDQLDGELFRKGGVQISDDRTGKVIHRPPLSEEGICNMLESWLQFLGDEELPFLVKVCIGHFFFENTHPFYDGNGRFGRYLMAKTVANNLDTFTALVISQKINEHKNTYYKLFQQTGDYLNRADATFFVQGLLALIQEGQEDILLLLAEKRDLLEDYREKINALEETPEQEKHILFVLAQAKLFVSDNSGMEERELVKIVSQNAPKVSVRSIKQALRTLVDKNLLQVVSRRPLRYRLTEIF